MGKTIGEILIEEGGDNEALGDLLGLLVSSPFLLGILFAKVTNDVICNKNRMVGQQVCNKISIIREGIPMG